MIDRFQNPNIVTDIKEPVDRVELYSQLDNTKLSKELLNSEVATFLGKYGLDESIVETHIYSAGNLLQSLPNFQLAYTTSEPNSTYDYDILSLPEYDIRQAGLTNGYYSIVYNYLSNLSDVLKIDDISADGTELTLSSFSGGNLNALWSYSELSNFSNRQNNIALNFGNNELAIITDISFENNPRVGQVTKEIAYPTDVFEGINTIFYPSLQDVSDNFWIEFKPNGRTTGRATKFIVTPTIVSGRQVDVTLEQETELVGTTLQPKYYSKNSTTDKFYDIDANLLYSGPVVQTKLIVSFFNESILTPPNGDITNVVVKLYKPLKASLENLNCKVDKLVRDTRVERIIVYPLIVEEIPDDFSPPNFGVDLGGYAQSVGTDLKNWNDLLDANLNTSQQIVDKYISSSFGNINLNVDYSSFDNFVHFSSAVERSRNFKYKLQLIESYNARISTLNSVSGSNSITNISQSISRRNSVISGFDGFEKWMYYETTGSLYTHYSSSLYTIKPWPKSSKYPLNLYHTTSSIASTYYNGLIDSASIFDAFNDARLTKLIPVSVAEDTLNSDYLLFIDMVGHHFDITWAYIKKLTSINSREEHPYDGMSNELLYDVAKSMGWQLTNGKQSSDLWSYAIGTDKFGNPIQSGSLESKSHEQINYEIWRRIVNNLPYLLKTKGTARSVKALFSTYGVPQTFLNIREYGGPVIDTEVRPIWEHERFVYNLIMSSPSYISVPWGKMNDLDAVTYTLTDPNPIDTIELQFKQSLSQKTTLLYKSGSSSVDFLVLLEPTASKINGGNIHFYLSGSSGYKSASISDVPVFDSTMSSFFLQRNTSVDDITQNNSYTIHYRRQRKGEIAIRKSASISIDGSTESSYNAAWTGSGDVLFGNPNVPSVGVPSLWASSNYISGSIQEIRYWAQPFEETIMDEHTLSREMYHGNSHTASFFDLKFRFITDSQIKNVTNPDGIASQHPNQQITTTTDGRIVSASLYNFNANDLVGVVDEYYTNVPSAGANNIMNNKVRIEPSSLKGMLDVDTKKEKSRYDSAPVDSNRLGIFLSATKMYNEDIYNHTGYFEIDDYIGNPDCRDGYNDTNLELDYLRRQVFRKYSSKNLINTIIDLLSRYDLSIFNQIKQVLPARVEYNSGILIEPHILERPKFKSTSKVSYTRPQYDVVLKQTEKPLQSSYLSNYEGIIQIDTDNVISGSKLDYESNIDVGVDMVITAQRDDLDSVGNTNVSTQYDSSVYEYVILNYSQSANVGYGINWTTGSNGSWNYNALGVTILNNLNAPYAKTEQYFYSSSLSASLGLYYSSSYIPAQTSTDNQSITLQNLKFLGCSISSDSITTNSTDTPDGGPVIEVYDADPNILVVTSQNANDGNLILGTNINVPTLLLEDLYVNQHIQFTQQQTYNSDLNMFNLQLQTISNVGETIEDYFDNLYSIELTRQEIENDRQSEFDILNGDL